MSSLSRNPSPEASTPLSEVEALGLEREAYRLSLAEQGYTSERIQYLVGREFGPRIARLALRTNIEALLEDASSAVEEPATDLARWARHQYELHGRDDVRSRQLPPGDRE